MRINKCAWIVIDTETGKNVDIFFKREVAWLKAKKLRKGSKYKLFKVYLSYLDYLTNK